jgi:hypothetical protein
VDVTESPTSRPKKNQKAYCSGKEWRAKAQVIIERNSLRVIGVQEAKGGGRDFKAYKETIGKSDNNSIPLDADLGCRGIEQCHSNSFIPKKPRKSHKLTK